MSGPLVFLASTTHLATKPKFQTTEIEPECSTDLFFGLHLNFGAKMQTEIELLSSTKLCKIISPPQNLLYQQKIDVYAHTNMEKICKKSDQGTSKTGSEWNC